jgi:hypothetical protein
MLSKIMPSALGILAKIARFRSLLGICPGDEEYGALKSNRSALIKEYRMLVSESLIEFVTFHGFVGLAAQIGLIWDSLYESSVIAGGYE